MTHMSMRHWGRRSRAVGLLAVAALALAAFAGAATSASATTSYFTNGQLVFSQTPIVWEGEMVVTGGLLDAGVECNAKAEGWVWKFGESKLTSITFSGCEFQSYGYCEQTVEPQIEKALNITWDGVLEAGNEDVIGESDYEPGLKAGCRSFDVKVSWECFAKPTMRWAMKNTSTGIATRFDDTEPLVCTEGAGTATVSGTGEMRTTNKEVLSFET